MSRGLSEELLALPRDVRELLDRYAFDRDRFLALAARVADDTDAANRVSGTVTPPIAGDVQRLEPLDGAALRALGEAALAKGECALVVLAGGMATRMGGVVKALTDAIPGKTFLDLRLAEVLEVERRYGTAPPLWLMTSHATHEKLGSALGAARDGYRVATFAQHLSVRLDERGKLLRVEGRPDVHAPGHGDLPDALRSSGLLDRFVDAGGKTILATNVDNLGATLDPTLLGFHLRSRKQVTCEVVDKVGSDRGGIPVRWNGRGVVLEEYRLPGDFDAASVRVFNTNTFWLDARALLDLDFEWTFFTVKKNVGGKTVTQFERLLGEITSALDTCFVHVPREGVQSRFLPVKDAPELALRREEIETVARSRGMLGA